MPIDAAWHRAHPMPQNSSRDARVRWHVAHAAACACRPVPASLQDAVATFRDAAATAAVDRPRCAWAGDDPLMIRYHDDEWGNAVRTTTRLFELIVLEGAQAGLSWRTVLRKRDGYRRAFADFDPARVARYDARKIARLMEDPEIVRSRAKIEAAIDAARAVLEIEREPKGFVGFVWSFVGGRPQKNRPKTMRDVPARTETSEAMSKALRARGFRFIGPTICYAFMQAAGLVDDHVRGCFRAGS